MGSVNSLPEPQITLSPTSISQSLAVLKSTFPKDKLKDPSESLYIALRTINQNFMQNNLYQIRDNNQTYINAVFLTLWFDKDFEKYCTYWFQYWKSLLQEITQSNTVLIKLRSWKLLFQLTKLLISVSTDRVFYVLNNIEVIALHSESKAIVKQYSTSAFDDEPKTTFISTLNRSQAQQLYKCLLIVLSSYLSLKTSAISRSDNTLDEITKFSEACFVIFCRVYFSQSHHPQLRKRAIKVNNETNLQHIAYFLGVSLEAKNSSLYDISVLFCISLIIGNKTNPNVTNLPSHLFKTLPTSPTNNIYNFILETLLLSLTHKKPDNIPRILSNRLNVLRLAYYLVSYSLATITEVAIDYLQNICTFTKMDQIQRVFITYLIEESVKVKEIDSLNKYHVHFIKPFELQLANTKLKFENRELIDYFVSHEDFLIEEMQTFYYDYLEENILKRKRVGLYQEKVYWERIINSKRENKVTC